MNKLIEIKKTSSNYEDVPKQHRGIVRRLVTTATSVYEELLVDQLNNGEKFGIAHKMAKESAHEHIYQHYQDALDSYASKHEIDAMDISGYAHSHIEIALNQHGDNAKQYLKEAE